MDSTEWWNRGQSNREVAFVSLPDDQFTVAGFLIEGAAKPEAGKRAEHDFGRRVHEASVQHVATDATTIAIGESDVQVWPIGREGSGQSEDFHFLMEAAAGVAVREAKMGLTQAADTCDNGGGFDGMGSRPFFERETQILAGCKAEGVEHGMET